MGPFEFTVYVRRWRSTRTYTITKTSVGWHVRHIAINGECEADGTPFFYQNFDQDNIVYPNTFGNFLEHIWTSLDEEKMSADVAQKRLQEIADWVSACERAQPEWIGWNV